MSKTSSSSLTPLPESAPPARRVMSPGLLAYRLRCLSDDLTKLAHAAPAADSAELLRARDALWLAARRLQQPSTLNAQPAHGPHPR